MESPPISPRGSPKGMGSPLASPYGPGTPSAAASPGATKGRLTEAQRRRQQRLAQGLPLGFTIEQIANSIVGKQLLRELMLYIPFLLMFVFFFLAQRSIGQEFYMAKSIRTLTGDLDMPTTSPQPGATPLTGPFFVKTYEDIMNAGDWYDWFEGVMIPAVLVNPPLNTQTRTIAGQNLLLHSLRVRTLKVRGDSCEVNSHRYRDGTTNHPCYDEYSSGDEDRTTFGKDGIRFEYTDGCHRSLQFIEGQLKQYPCGGFTIDIPFNTTLATGLAIAKDMRTASFINETSTRFVVVEYHAYNIALNTFLAVRMFVEMTEGGGFERSQRYRVFPVYSKDTGYIVFSFFFFVFVLYYCKKFVQDWYADARRTRKAFNFIFDIWNFFELINMLSFLITFAAFWAWWFQSVKLEWVFPQFTQPYSEDLAFIMELYYLQVYFNSLNTILSFIKVLKFVRLNDRLNILTRTLETSAQNILAILIIFTLIVTGYAVAGWSIYGTSIWEFRNMSAAFSSLFRLLIGDFNYASMRSENRAITFVYFWSFVVFGLFVMLNFLVGAIMEGFAEENKKTRAVPFSEQIKNLWYSITGFFSTPGALNAIVAAAVARTKRLREETLLEYLVQWRDASQDRDINDRLFYRHEFPNIMPRSELEDLGDEYLNLKWEEVLVDYEHTTLDEHEAHINSVKDVVWAATSQATAACLIEYHKSAAANSPFGSATQASLPQVATVSEIEDGEAGVVEAQLAHEALFNEVCQGMERTETALRDMAALVTHLSAKADSLQVPKRRL